MRALWNGSRLQLRILRLYRLCASQEPQSSVCFRDQYDDGCGMSTIPVIGGKASNRAAQPRYRASLLIVSWWVTIKLTIACIQWSAVVEHQCEFRVLTLSRQVLTVEA